MFAPYIAVRLLFVPGLIVGTHIGETADNNLFQHDHVHIGEFVDVKAALAGLMLAKPGEFRR